MTKTFYTNVQVFNSKILYRGIENGRRVRNKIEYCPSLFLTSKQPTKYTTIKGEHLEEIKPGTIKDCRDFVKKYSDIDNFKIYGNQRYEYVYISDQHPLDVDWDKEYINICNIDIEVGSENGFPDPNSANEPIIAIACGSKSRITVFGYSDFNNLYGDSVQFIRCDNETDLIKRFLDYWCADYPDIITGWNVKFFDIPYLVNRIRNLLGEDIAKKLSPWNFLTERSVFMMGRDQKTYVPFGISVLDYIELYRKYAPGGNSQESYKLDAICNVEIGERKLSYEEYGDLHSLYKKDYQKFIEYNIRDVELVDKLDDKLKLIDLALTLAYDSKTNYEDVFTQVRMWDILIYNHLRKQNIVIPPLEKHTKKHAYVGAYVKTPIIGMHNWIASFDLNSLYPHLIMEFNISPETLVDWGGKHWFSHYLSENKIDVDTLLEQSIDTSMLKTYNVTMTPNGQFFKTDKQGFLPKMMEEMYNDRTAYKNKAIEARKGYEKESDPDKRQELEKLAARYNNLQLAKKVSLNSAYGALGNEYFRFFDVRQASAVTTSGQLVIRWIELKINKYLNKILGTTDKDYVIASDTDSIYLCLDELVRRTIIGENPTAGKREIISFLDRVCEIKLQPFIDKSYMELAQYLNAYSQKMKMKRESLADKGIWTAKKRYILNVYNSEGVEYAKPKVKAMGMEMIKSSTPSFCRKKLWEAIDIILKGTENDVLDFIEKCKSDFKISSIEDISFPRGVNGLEKFSDDKSIYGDGCPIHVRGALIYNRLLQTKKLARRYPTIKEGEKIKFIYMREPNIIQSNIISFPQVLPKEFNLTDYVDYDTQFEKSFVEPLKIILDCLGWKTERTASLEAFFA